MPAPKVGSSQGLDTVKSFAFTISVPVAICVPGDAPLARASGLWQRVSMRKLFVLFCLFLLGASAPPGPERIISLNLCADQYLLALADPDQIGALTKFARDPQMSAAAEKATNLPTSAGSAEQVLALRPDLVFASSTRRRETLARLRDRNIPIIKLPSAKSYGDILDQIRLVAKATGHEERGKRLIDEMDERLARLPSRPGRNKVAAYYQRRGFLTGTGTLVDDMMRRLGLTNLASQLGKPSLARVSLEEIALARPDYLIVEKGSTRIEDRGTEMLSHPLIRSIPRLEVPQAWTVCGGPAYVRALESLSAQLSADE
ncbi:MAG: ABC transporter substrate-binding protein [Pseudomonadota bacterium]